MALRSGLAVVSAIVLLTAVGIFALETNRPDPGGEIFRLGWYP